MQLQKFCLERYKGYTNPVEVELAPLTILVGANNSGKTALAQAIQLLAGGLAASEENTSEPLPLESGGIRHGTTFEDLVSGRPVHGRLHLSATLWDRDSELSLSAKVRNVVAPTRSERQISEWSLGSGDQVVMLERQDFDERSPYKITVSGKERAPQQINWQGLIPRQSNNLAQWIAAKVGPLRNWALGVRHLRCPRYLLASPFITEEHLPVVLGPNGEKSPLALAADDELRESVRQWYRNAFGVSIAIASQGIYSELVVETQGHNGNIRLEQSGRGLSHVLPVVVMALTTRKAGSGVDVIEHPESELHPAAHADIAELLLENLAGPERPMVIETHSEMVLLRTRRWIAEGRLSANDVLVYWVHADSRHGSVLQKIRINETGEMECWPDGVFIEDYEEILAIRRAARQKE